MLLQWVRWGLGLDSPPEMVWEKDGRFHDPFRPTIEPDGFASPAEVAASRALTMESFGAALRTARVFIFTLGLTESWQDRAGFEYAICPGTVAGAFDGSVHLFLSQDYDFILDRLTQAITAGAWHPGPIADADRSVAVLIG